MKLVIRIVSLVLVALLVIAPLSAFADWQNGDVGGRVKEIQKYLCAAGFPTLCDNAFGPKTEVAVKNFQNKAGLPVTGVVDDATLSALKKEYKAKPSAWQNASSYASKTPYVLEVNLSTQTVRCYKGKNGSRKQIGPTVHVSISKRVKAGEYTLGGVGKSKFISRTGLSGIQKRFVKKLDDRTKVVVVKR